jgi:hypothetical protein
MQLSTNQRFQGLPQVGNTVERFKRMKEMIEINDGRHQCNNRLNYCIAQQTPFPFRDHTQIALTHKDFDIINLRKAFLTARLRIMVSIPDLGTITDPDHLVKLFVGYRASVQAFHKLIVYVNDVIAGYSNRYIVQEGVAFATNRPHTAKDKKRFIYSSYENVSHYMPDICGAYINAADFADHAPHPVEFEINIPIIDFLALQCFDKWTRDFGTLTLEL